MGLAGPGAVLAGTDDPYTAFCLDEAVALWGNAVEQEMERSVEGVSDPHMRLGARQRAFDRCMSDPDEPVAPGRFADPAQLFAEKKEK